MKSLRPQPNIRNSNSIPVSFENFFPKSVIDSSLDFNILEIFASQPGKAGTHPVNFEKSLRTAPPIRINRQVFVLSEEITADFFHVLVGLQGCVDPPRGVFDDGLVFFNDVI